MAWGSDTSLGSQTAINNTVEEYLPSSGGISLNPRESCHVQLEIDNEDTSTVTDALEVYVYTTLDDTSEDWDEIPYMAFSVEPSGVTAEDYSFVVSGPYKFRMGFLSAGTTDTYTVGGNYRKDGVSA